MENERDKILKIVGNNIKNIRKLKGYTQESFAETLGKSINYISLVELGKSGMSNTSTNRNLQYFTSRHELYFQRAAKL